MADKPFKTGLLLIFAAIGIVVGCLIVWIAIDIFLLAFSAVLFAILLNTISRYVHDKAHLPYILSLFLVLIVGIGFFVGIFWFFSPIINEQLKELVVTLPQAFVEIKTMISKFINIDFLSSKITNELFLKNDKLFAQITSVFSVTIGTIAFLLLFFIVGIYLAYNPRQYGKGFLLIFPPSKREYINHFLEQMTSALRWWLFGKIIAMMTVGIMTYVGLMLLEVPLAFILGLLSACLTFIPYIGPIIASIPAILIALTLSPAQALYVIIVYIIIHIVEGYLITPVIDQKTVALPPALTIMMQVLLGLLVGFLGILLASPLTVLLFVIFKQLYVKKSNYKLLQ